MIIVLRHRSRPEWDRLLDAGYRIGLPVRAWSGRAFWSVLPCRWKSRSIGPVKCPACHRPFYEPVRRVCRACMLDLADIPKEV